VTSTVADPVLGSRGRRRALRVLGAVVLSLIAVSVVLPLLYTLNTALKSPLDYALNNFGIVSNPTFENFSYFWEHADPLTGLRNSLIVAGGTIALIWVTASLAGFAVSKLDFRFRLILFFVVLSSAFVPLQTILAPIYQELGQLGLLDTHVGLILVYTAFGMPLAVFLFAAYFNGIPTEVIEAARIDGASPFRIWLRVIMPMARPALAITGVINFVTIFNDFLTPVIVIQSPEKQLFVVKVAQSLSRFPPPTQQAAGVFIGMLPLLLIFLFGQRFLIRGITAGAVK
jgi:ABC-type glycerol-3-phosphate transport system permease component